MKNLLAIKKTLFQNHLHSKYNFNLKKHLQFKIQNQQAKSAHAQNQNASNFTVNALPQEFLADLIVAAKIAAMQMDVTIL